MNFTVVEGKASTMSCPCGCGAQLAVRDGELRMDSRGAYFRIAMLPHAPEGPTAWIAIVASAPVGAEDTRDWLVTVESDYLGAWLRDSEQSPITPAEFAGRKLTRDEVLAHPGAPEFYFAACDALFLQHSELADFLS